MSSLPPTAVEWARYIDAASVRPDRAQHLLDELAEADYVILEPSKVEWLRNFLRACGAID